MDLIEELKNFVKTAESNGKTPAEVTHSLLLVCALTSKYCYKGKDGYQKHLKDILKYTLMELDRIEENK